MAKLKVVFLAYVTIFTVKPSHFLVWHLRTSNPDNTGRREENQTPTFPTACKLRQKSVTAFTFLLCSTLRNVSGFKFSRISVFHMVRICYEFHLLWIGRETTRSQCIKSCQIFTLTLKCLPCLFFTDNQNKPAHPCWQNKGWPSLTQTMNPVWWF